MKVGVLTGGGDCPGLNAVIRAVTKSALNRFKLEVIGIEDGFLGLIQNRMRKLNWNDVSNILTSGGTILGASNAANPKRYAVKRSGRTEFADVSDRVIEHIQHSYEGKLKAWSGRVGWEKLANSRGPTWRKIPESARENLNEAKALKLLEANSSAIKRPVVEWPDGGSL